MKYWRRTRDRRTEEHKTRAERKHFADMTAAFRISKGTPFQTKHKILHQSQSGSERHVLHVSTFNMFWKTQINDRTTQTKTTLVGSALLKCTRRTLALTEDWGCRPGWIWNVSCISHLELNYNLQGMKSPVNCRLSTWRETFPAFDSRAMCTLFRIYWLHQLYDIFTKSFYQFWAVKSKRFVKTQCHFYATLMGRIKKRK